MGEEVTHGERQSQLISEGIGGFLVVIDISGRRSLRSRARCHAHMCDKEDNGSERETARVLRGLDWPQWADPMGGRRR